MVCRLCSLGRARLCVYSSKSYLRMTTSMHKWYLLVRGWARAHKYQTTDAPRLILHSAWPPQRVPPQLSKGLWQADLYLVMSTKNNSRDSSIHTTFDLNQHGLVICQTSSGVDHKLTHRQSHPSAAQTGQTRAAIEPR